jgi:DHA2 family multidrug resistance protein
MALSPGGLVLMVMMPIAGFIVSTKIDPRVMIMTGFLATAAGLYNMTNISLDVDFRTMVELRMIQVIGLPLIFIPISTLNYVGVPREKRNQVAGISNFARNLGGSIGTSLLTTFIARQNQVHQSALAAHAYSGNASFDQMLASLKSMFISQGYDAVTAATMALAQVYRTVQAQASALSFENSFFVMAVAVLCLAPFPFIMRRPKPSEMATRAGH